MKLALILNVIDPLIGGVLIMGHRGTGKSTAVRALADLLPQMSVVEGCIYRCDPKDEQAMCWECTGKVASGTKLSGHPMPVPVVELPLGATEDRVCGTIAVERVLKEGVKTFEPGLLAKANRGFLYIDEVNLLEDHLVDLLLDVAVTGWNRVEREGVSIEHPARFVLIGSGNPEEGELRPQLLDRFGLHAEIKTEDGLGGRVTVLERREAYDRDAARFRATFSHQQDDLRRRINYARRNFAKVSVKREILHRIAQLCTDLKIDGHRGELTIMRAARALAAFAGRRRATEADVRQVAIMALRHRMRRSALEEAGSTERIERAVEQVFAEKPDESGSMETDGASRGAIGEQQSNNRVPIKGKRLSKLRAEDGKGTQELSPSAPTSDPVKCGMQYDTAKAKSTHRTQGGGRAVGARRKVTSSHRGRYARSVSFKRDQSRIAIAATLQALLVHRYRAVESSSWETVGSQIPDAALRYKLFRRKQGTLFVLAIDASGSMARSRITIAKRVMLARLQQSYVNRDKVAIVAFRGQDALLALPPSRSSARARRVLDSLQVGGGTPLSAGLACTLNLVKSARVEHDDVIVLLFTDGQANVPLQNEGGLSTRAMIEAEVKFISSAIQQTRAQIVVVDTKHEFESSIETERLAALLNGQFIKILPGL
jgi:magnesium chelatase subunit D